MSVVGDRDTTMRRRIVAAAAELTVDVGWSAVTMAAIADRVGVSRQTVYNELGSKSALGEAMVLEQLASFLAVVVRAFDSHSGDPVAAITDAVQRVLELAITSPLVRAVVSATHGANIDLLPFLTTSSDALLRSAREVVATRLGPMTPHLTRVQLDATVDVLVRVVLSHIMQPSDAPARSAQSVALVLAPVLVGCSTGDGAA